MLLVCHYAAAAPGAVSAFSYLAKARRALSASLPVLWFLAHVLTPEAGARFRGGGRQLISNRPAAPMPPPMHMVTTA